MGEKEKESMKRKTTVAIRQEKDGTDYGNNGKNEKSQNITEKSRQR